MQPNSMADSIKKFAIDLNNDAPKPSRFSFKEFMGNSKLEHYQSIRGGTFFEKVLKDMIRVSTNCTLINRKFAKGKQIDLLFTNKLVKTAYYFEVRTNIDNDTEKTPATAYKIEEVRKHISSLSEYSGYTVVYGILCPTNLSESGITYGKNINVYSLSDFLGFIGTPVSELSDIVKSIRELYSDCLKQ